jgi:hypothetical protein
MFFSMFQYDMFYVLYPSMSYLLTLPHAIVSGCDSNPPFLIILGGLAQLCGALIKFAHSVRPSVHTEELNK